MQSTTFVYVMACDSRSKIGISMDPERRIKKLQLANPHPISFEFLHGCDTRAFARQIESLAHDNFADSRLFGEWFNVRPREASDFVSQAIERLAPKAETAASVPSQDRYQEAIELQRPIDFRARGLSFQQMDALTDQEWAEYMRPLAALLEVEVEP